jgi:hypothetical protein
VADGALSVNVTKLGATLTKDEITNTGTLGFSWNDGEVSNTLTSSIFVGTGSSTDAIDLASAEVAGVLADGNVTDTLTIGASSTVADGALSANVTKLGATLTKDEITNTGTLGFSWSDGEVSDTLTSSIFIGSGSTTNAIDLATAEVSGNLLATRLQNAAADLGGADININFGNSNIGGFNTNLSLDGSMVIGSGMTVTGNTSVTGNILAQRTGVGGAVIVDRTDGVSGSLKAGSAKIGFFFDDLGSFAIAKDSRANILAGIGGGVDLLTVDASGNAAVALGNLTVTTGSIVTSNLGVDFTESDTNPTCAAGDYRIFADLSESKLKKCQNGVVSDVDSSLHAIQQFAAGGTWTKPADVNSVYVEVWGGGGGGGTAAANASRGGGGSGAFSAGIVSVTGNVTVTVGGAGTANGGAGGASSFAGATTPSAGGGTGVGASLAGGAGGTASGGTININGQAGSSTLAVDGARGGNGGSAPRGGGGGDGGTAVALGGTGQAGQVGSFPGGGGGGGAESAGAGAAGAGGLVVVYEYSGTLGADLAEWYPTELNVEAADIVAVGDGNATYEDAWSNQDISILRKAKRGDRIMGVVTTQPSLLMGSNVKSTGHTSAVALAGRVPVKVTTENGVVKPGDLLTISATVPGAAMKATKAGQIVGQALSGYSGEGVGAVLIFIKPDYSQGAKLADVIKDYDEADENSTLGKNLLNYLLEERDSIVELNASELFTDRIAAGLEIITPRLVAHEVQTSDIIVGEQGISFKREDGTIVATISRDGVFSTNTTVVNNQTIIQANTDQQVVESLTVSRGLFANGALTVKGSADFKDSAIFRAIASFEAGIEVKGSASFAGVATFNSDAGGYVTVPAGQSSIRVNFSKAYQQTPVVTISLGQGKFARYTYDNLTSNGFDIILDEPASADYRFSWTALSVQ